MPRVYKVESARKPRPELGIAVGDSYYYWKRRKGPLQMSKAYPKRSQLTGSAFLGSIYDIEDRIAALTADDSLPEAVEGIVQELRDLAEECQSSLDNMPEGLQQGDTGQLLETRVEGCNNAADELEGIDFSDAPDGEPDEPEEPGEDASEEERAAYETAKEEYENSDEAADNYWDEKLGEVQGVEISYE